MALFVWLVLQLTPVLLAASHIRLWATAPGATESLSLDALLITQFIGSSLLFPFLCRTWQRTCAVVLASAPLTAVACLLAGVNDATLVVVWINLSLWLLGLHFWQRMLTTSSAQMICVSIVASLNITGILLVYLSAETNVSLPWANWIPAQAALRSAHLPQFPTLLPAVSWLVVSAIASQIFRINLSTTLSTERY